jgi:predicted ArsR family transcriptional regulator
VPDAATIDQLTHRVLAGRSRVRVLEYLRGRDEPVTAAEVADHVGLHANTVRLHLDQLADAGLVMSEREPRRGPGRPRLLYSAAAARPAPPVEPAEDGYRVLAGVLAGRLEEISARPADDAVAAGRAWARTLAAAAAPAPSTTGEAAERLIAALDELGFAPARPAGADGPIELHRCPFHQVATQHSAVVCGVHLGLMQGLLDDLQALLDDVAAPLHATRLEPFVAPGLCLAHLAPRAPLEPPAPAGTDAPPTEGF